MEKYYVFDTKYNKYANTTNKTNTIKRLIVISCITMIVTFIVYSIVAICYTSYEFGSYTDAMNAKYNYIDSVCTEDMTYADTFKTAADEWVTGIKLMFE